MARPQPGKRHRHHPGECPRLGDQGPQLDSVLLLPAQERRNVEVLTLHLGPEDILVNLSLEFVDGLDTNQLEAAVDRIEKNIRDAVPEAHRIFIEADSIKRA